MSKNKSIRKIGYLKFCIWQYFLSIFRACFHAGIDSKTLNLCCAYGKCQVLQVRLNYVNTHHDPPPSTTTHHNPKYIHHQPPPAKICPPPRTTSHNIPTITHLQPKYIHHHLPFPKMDHHPAKAKITSFRHCFNSFFIFEVQYTFPWRTFCVIKFWSVSKFQISTTFSTFYNTYEFKVTRFILLVFINKMVIDVMLTWH